MRRPDADRRHLVIALTDGVDAGSLIEASTLREIARRAEAVLHLVLLSSDPAPQLNAPHGWWSIYPGAGDRRLLIDAAGLTGGQAHTAAFRDPIVSAFQQAFDDFRLSYLLRYTPAHVAHEGWHDLRVDVPGKNYKIRARQGYFGG
jgi:VWFA-related protein